MKIIWAVQNFIQNWVYPAYFLRNFLFNHYNIIKLTNLSSYDYYDATVRMVEGPFQIIKDFVEKEKPEKYIQWYGQYGHKYDGKLYPELKDKYIMDIIKEIYNWYTKELPLLQNDSNYLLHVWATYISNFIFEECEDNPQHELLVSMPSTYSVDDVVIQELDWNILNKYGITKENIFNADILKDKQDQLQRQIYQKKQYYLHLCIEIRTFLWT